MPIPVIIAIYLIIGTAAAYIADVYKSPRYVAAVFLFWPIVLLVLATKGMLEVFKGK